MKIGKSRSYVTNALSLLDLDPFLHACIACNLLTVSHIRAISKLPPEIEQYRIADLAIDWGFTVREPFDVVNQILEGRDFLWFRQVPIEKIVFPGKALNPGSGYAAGTVVIDASYCLVGGFDQLYKSVLQGEETVYAAVIYWRKWLDPALFQLSVAKEKVEMKGKNMNHMLVSKFGRVLSQLVDNPKTLRVKYPIHRVQINGDYFHFKIH